MKFLVCQQPGGTAFFHWSHCRDGALVKVMNKRTKGCLPGLWKIIRGRLFQVLVPLLMIPAATGGTIPLPPRPAAARGGMAVAQAAAGLDLPAREAVLVGEILAGNVPDFWRRFVEVTILEGGSRLVLLVAPDYLAVGSDADFFRTPLTPGAAAVVARRLHCTLPTTKLVDAIHRAAAVKLPPLPQAPGPGMTTIPACLAYQKVVRTQRAETLAAFPLGALVAGHQKDIVLTPQLREDGGKVAIYGWHRLDGTPIQPLFTGHAETWVDYSHGVRLISETASLNSRRVTLRSVRQDPRLARLLSDEAPSR
jgi:hypothetical protein